MFEKKWCLAQQFCWFHCSLSRIICSGSTARTANVNLYEVEQQSKEVVIRFYARFISIIDKIELMVVLLEQPLLIFKKSNSNPKKLCWILFRFH
jgi:hypothetical protein